MPVGSWSEFWCESSLESFFKGLLEVHRVEGGDSMIDVESLEGLVQNDDDFGNGFDALDS